MTDAKTLEVLKDIRNWIRAASHASIKKQLEAALPDTKSRAAYQMLDGKATMEQVRIACKMSPNGLFALAQRWTAMGLMEVTEDKRRVRLFDLTDFGLIESKESMSGTKAK